MSQLVIRVLSSLVVALLAGATAWAGPKIDVVVLENGDRVTCEIRALSRGRLSLGTDAFDTIEVYWDRVTGLSSPRAFQVELAGGQRLYGSLTALPDRRVRIEQAGAPGVDVGLGAIIRIAPIEATIWEQMGGHVDLGFNFAKANRETRYTLNADNTFRNRHYESRLTLGSQVTRRDDAERIERTSVSFTGKRLLGPRWSALLIAQYQKNEELSLDNRTIAGGGAGRYLVQSNRTMLMVYGGAAWTREQFSGIDASSRAEAVLGTNWDWFSAHDSDIDLTTTAVWFYSLNSDDRLRFDVQSALRLEFLKDFYVSLNGYTSADSRPPSGREKVDLGVSLTLGWKY